MLLTVILIIISSSSLSPPHSFIPGLKPSFSANPSHRSLPFLFQDWLHGFPRLLTVTSEHIRCFYILVFFCFTLFSCRFRAVVWCPSLSAPPPMAVRVRRADWLNVKPIDQLSSRCLLQTSCTDWPHRRPLAYRLKDRSHYAALRRYKRLSCFTS